MRSGPLGWKNGTILDPKCDNLFIPDGVLGAGEAMRRREFIAFVGSTAVAWPLAARAQQPNALRVIGVLTGGAGPDSTARLEVFLRALAQLGWTESHNVRFDIRRGGGDLDNIRKYAAELAARTPDVIVAIGGPATGALLQATHTVPIVFTIAPDPVAAGLVASLSQPGATRRVS
jgi:putative ABC transport system substrate-binding protein